MALRSIITESGGVIRTCIETQLKRVAEFEKSAFKSKRRDADELRGVERFRSIIKDDIQKSASGQYPEVYAEFWRRWYKQMKLRLLLPRLVQFAHPNVLGIMGRQDFTHDDLLELPSLTDPSMSKFLETPGSSCYSIHVEPAVNAENSKYNSCYPDVPLRGGYHGSTARAAIHRMSNHMEAHELSRTALKKYFAKQKKHIPYLYRFSTKHHRKPTIRRTMTFRQLFFIPEEVEARMELILLAEIVNIRIAQTFTHAHASLRKHLEASKVTDLGLPPIRIQGLNRSLPYTRFETA